VFSTLSKIYILSVPSYTIYMIKEMVEMPIEGYSTITVSDAVKKELKERAEKEGLSVPQLIEQYMTHATHINQLTWLDRPENIKERIDLLTREIKGIALDRRLREWAKGFRLKGETVPSEVPYEEKTQWDNECGEIAKEIAEAIIERNKESYEEFKKKTEEENLKFHLRQPSNEPKDVQLDSLGRFYSCSYKTNAEIVHEKLQSISNRVKELFGRKASLSQIGKNVVEVSELMAKWNELRKYVPYLSEEDKKLDSEIAKILGVQ